MMRPFTLPLIAAAVIWAAPALAREVTAQDREAVAGLIEQLDAGMESGDMMSAMDVVPPALFEAMAEAMGLSPEEMRGAIDAALEQAMAGVEIVSHEMRLDDAREGETSEGRPYLLVPTETVMKAGEDTVRNESDTLALEDGGAWYLVRIDDLNQVAMVQEVYPDFAGVEFPRGRMSVVE